MDNETGMDDKEIEKKEEVNTDVNANADVNGNGNENEIETEQLNEDEQEEQEKEQGKEPMTTDKVNIDEEEDINPLCNLEQDQDKNKDIDKVNKANDKEKEKDKDEEQTDNQLNDNIDNNTKQQQQQQRNTNNEQYNKQRESNGTEIKKTDHDLLENLSNDSFEKKFNQLQEKLFNRPNRAVLSEDRHNPHLSTSKGSKGVTINPKLEEIFAMLEAKDFKREIRELNKRPDNMPDTRNNKFAIKNIMNYSPPKEIRYLSQDKDRRANYNYTTTNTTNFYTKTNNAAQVKINNPPPMKFNDVFKSNIQTAFKGSVDRDKDRDRNKDKGRDRRDKGYFGIAIVNAVNMCNSSYSHSNTPSSVVIDKIVPRKRDPLYNKDYFKAELSSLNMKLFGNEAKKNKKGNNGHYTKENFYI